jgi:hypothetical protein
VGGKHETMTQTGIISKWQWTTYENNNNKMFIHNLV